MRSPVRRAALAGVCLVLACSSSPTGTDNNNGGNGTNYNTATGTMTADIDGTSWTANFLTRAVFNSGTLSITGELFNGNTSTIRVITIAATSIDTNGVYSIGPTSVVGGNALMTLGSTFVWSSVGAGGSGTLTITARDGTHVAGKFAFVGVIGTGPNSNVTNGVFDIPF